MRYILDTHVWVWWHDSPSFLSRKAREVLSHPSKYEELLLSVISVWELCKLIQKGRIDLSCSVEDWIEEALDMPKLRLLPLTPSIAYRSTVLPGEFHDDPADQIIVASAREENVVIITKDDRIREYRHVRTVW